MYVRNTVIRTINQGGPKCVNIEEADRISSQHSPEEIDFIAAPGSVALTPKSYTS